MLNARLASKRDLSLVLVLAVVSGPALGCTASEEDPGPTPITFEGVVDDHRDRFDSAPLDCGAVEIPYDECRADLSAQEQCLWDAYNGCDPAELSLILPTTDAGPMPAWMFVRITNYGCEIDFFLDHEADPYKGDYGDFTHDSCTVLDGPDPDPDACAELTPLECERVGEWWADGSS